MVSRDLYLWLPTYGDMAKSKHIDKFANGPGCRAKARALRTIAEQVANPRSKARMLDMACAWDARAETYDTMA
jgi:hypothetical protein